MNVSKQEFLDGIERERERRKKTIEIVVIKSDKPLFLPNAYVHCPWQSANEYLNKYKRRVHCN